MKLFVTFIIAMALLSCQGNSDKSKPLEPVKPGTDYLFFLHNRFLEDNGLDARHPEYGKVEYAQMLESFRNDGFIVISEKRPKNTDPKQYAMKVKSQIDSLLAAGAAPEKITVVGTSKGGYIAQYVSTLAANPKINYVFIGCFMDADIDEMPDINFCGNILTIYDKGDPLGVSAIRRKETSRLKVNRFKEIELDTKRKHGFLYKALPEWLEPSKQWARHKAD